MAPDSTPGDVTPSRNPAQSASSSDIGLLGAGHIFICLLIANLFISWWISDLSDVTKGGMSTTITWFGTHWTLTTEIDERLLLLAMVTGAFGSLVRTATSFSDFVGNQKPSTNWRWWYIHRPFIGMSLAAIFYIAIRPGFLSAGGSAAMSLRVAASPVFGPTPAAPPGNADATDGCAIEVNNPTPDDAPPAERGGVG